MILELKDKEIENMIKPTEEVEKEFDEKFPKINGEFGDRGTWSRKNGATFTPYSIDLNDFITSTRKDDLERLIAEVEGLIDANDDGMWAGRETADKILSLLKANLKLL